ncbi:hypothetical protein ACQJBY_061612 [Aegilops geniculata]
MAAKNPSYYQTSPCQEVKQKEHRFHLYMDQHGEGKTGANQIVPLKRTPANEIEPEKVVEFGLTAVVDWSVCDGRAPEANIVARAKGTSILADMTQQTWFMCYTLLFSDERFKGSSLECIGSHVSNTDGQYAVVGGTGEFAGANGVVNVKIVEYLPDTTGVIRELNIRVSCPCPNPTPVTKIGPWGGNGGTTFDIPDLPLSIQSVTITCGDVIHSLAFSYVDKTGQKKNVGPWGAAVPLSVTITLASSEILKQFTGTTNNIGGDNTVVTSLAFTTNVSTYGPFGKSNGTPFSSQVPDNSSIVGFYARAGGSVNALGAYVCPN